MLSARVTDYVLGGGGLHTCSLVMSPGPGCPGFFFYSGFFFYFFKNPDNPDRVEERLCILFRNKLCIILNNIFENFKKSDKKYKKYIFWN